MAIGGNQRVIRGNQEAIKGKQRTIRASESVATGGRFAATVSASSTGAYLMKEAISAHQWRTRAQSRAIARNQGGAPLIRPDPQSALYRA